MLKQYFTDGLIQIAIVLSLLRTDLNDYISRNYVNYPEVQEIILGQSAAYTQTNFHNQHNYLGSPEIYRKNIDSVTLPTIFRDLRSFQHSFSSRQRIDTFLLIEGGPSSSGYRSSEHLTDPVQEQTDNEDENNNNVESSSVSNLNELSSEDLELESQHLLTTLEERIGAIAPFLESLNNQQGTDPTMEDLDLIDVLWRQDIDLGVGKEVFDPNIRRELERDREIELQKERQKQKEQELLQAKAEEQRRQAEQRWLHDNFTQDGETGEWIPLGGNRVPPPPPNEGEQYLPNYNDMQIQEPNTGYVAPTQGTHLPPPPYQGPAQPLHPHTSQMYQPSQMGHQYGNHGNHSTQAGFPVPPSQCNMTNMNNSNTGYLQQQSQYNNTHYQHNYTHTMQHHNPAHQLHVQHQQQLHQQQQQQHNHHQQQQQNYPRQQSLEATWQDLVHILDLPSNQSAVTAAGQAAQVGNMMVNNNVSQIDMDNNSSVLLQNASMPTPAPRNENVTFNTQGPVSQAHRSPPHSSGLMSPNQAFNSSIPGGSSINNVEWDPCQNFLFPNISQSEGLEDVDELLPDLITEDELDEIKFADIDLSDDVTSPTSRGFTDDGSSESVMSVGSGSVGSPEQNELSDSALSPFDGMVGATGGHDSPCPKVFKEDPDDYKYGKSCSYSCGDSNSSNFSSSSNDSHGGGPYNGHGGGHFSPPNNGHINHNHTYPMKPGQDPKDFRRISRKGKGPQSKDGKRLLELNVPFTLDQIVDSPVEEFNDMLTRHKLNEQQLQLIRDIRRRGKNKVAAQNCRKRKLYVLENLEDEMTSLEKFRDKLVQERHLIDKQTREMKEKLGNLYSEIFHSLRDEHGRPYDPARFSLQQSSDGDVFLVPRNYTTEDDIKKKRHDDRNYD